MPLKISAFPKCYLDTIAGTREMTVFQWIEMAKTLDADGLEMYDGFFTSLDNDYIDKVANAIHDAGFAMPMLCCSPDFTHPDANVRKQMIDTHIKKIEVTRRLGGKGAVCRVLSGQRFPEVSRAQGLAWAADCIKALLPVARENGIILGLENHYKDGFWKYPEFAQKMDVFLDLVNSIEDLRKEEGGSQGYAKRLRHGEIGKGLNDYDAIFTELKSKGFDGWISIEDGVDGMEQLARSVEFLKSKIAQHWK